MVGTNSILWLHQARSRKEHMQLSASASASSSSSFSSSSHLSREQQVMLNFDEIVAIWYFALMLWYGYFRFRNWKVAVATRQQLQLQLQLHRIHSTNDNNTNNTKYGFSPVHWLILSIAFMGLANFLFSVSLLEAMDRTSSIGSKMLKLSYVNMFLACLRHPCILSLGVLAPKVAFGSDRYYYFPSQSTAALGGESIKSIAMCLAALACAQIILRMTENLMVIFRYGGGRDSATVKLADFFEFVIDGMFLVWMVHVLWSITMELSRDEYQGRSRGPFGPSRWQAWWKSQSLFFFWVLYTIFVTVSTALILIGVSTFLGASSFNNEHFVLSVYKAHAINDLLLVTGIAIVLRPKAIVQSQSPFHANGNSGDGAERDVDVDYSLLLAESSSNDEEEDKSDDDGTRDEEGGINFEMTITATAPDSVASGANGET